MIALPLAPVATILLFTLGLALIYVELNRPGLILPGAAGLLATLLAFASIAKYPYPVLPLGLLILALLVLYLDDRRPRLVTAACAGALLLLGFRVFAPQSALPTRITAILCAVLIAVGSHFLNRIAYQARVNKGAAKPSKSSSNS